MRDFEIALGGGVRVPGPAGADVVIADYDSGLRLIASGTALSRRVMILTHSDSEAKICHALEQVCIETVESGKMTKDLAVCIHGNKVEHGKHYLYTEEFLDALDTALKAKLA